MTIYFLNDTVVFVSDLVRFEKMNVCMCVSSTPIVLRNFYLEIGCLLTPTGTMFPSETILREATNKYYQSILFGTSRHDCINEGDVAFRSKKDSSFSREAHYKN
jgi:hypothetical protein